MFNNSGKEGKQSGIMKDKSLKVEEHEQHNVGVFEGVKRVTLACGKDILMAKFIYEKDSKVPPHKHSYEQVTTVLKGEQKIIIKDEEGKQEFIVKSGESYVVPPNFEHEQITLKETTTIDVWSLSP